MFIATFFAMGEAAGTTSVTERFSRILDFTHQLAEADTSIDQESFAKDIADTVKIFEKIEQRFEHGIFEQHETVRDAFVVLCGTIEGVDEKAAEAEQLKPRYIRWIRNDIDQLMHTLHDIIHKMSSVEDRNSLILLSNFANNMEDKIFPRCYHVVGTRFDSVVDNCVFRPAEFYKRHWKWTIPVTVLALKMMYDARNLAGEAGEITLPNVEHASESSGFISSIRNTYYKWLLLPIVGLFTSFAGRDGVLINPQTGIPTREPLQAVFMRDTVMDRNNNQVACINQIPQFNTNLRNDSRQRIALSIPSSQQNDGKSCPFYATYNILCLRGEHYRNDENQNNHNPYRLKDLTDRTKCNQVINHLKYMLRMRRVGDLPTTICREAGINVPQNLTEEHRRWIAQDANRRFIQNNNMHEIFAKWYNDISAVAPDLGRIRQRAVNKVCFNSLYGRARGIINSTDRTGIEKRDLLDLLRRQHINALVGRNIEAEFDTIFPQWQNQGQEGNITIGNFVPAVPNDLNDFPKRIRCFVRSTLDALPSDTELTWLIRYHVPQLSTIINALGDRDLLPDVSILSRASAPLLTGPVNNNGGNNRINFRAGMPQFIIFFTGPNPNADTPALRFNQDIWRSPSSFVAGNHVIAMKIEWTDPNNPGRCPPRTTVLESSGSRAPLYAKDVHIMTELFVNG